jgi:hypothetical protein
VNQARERLKTQYLSVLHSNSKMTQRQITHQYRDPIELIWLRAANDLGLVIERSTEVFAAYDGKGTLTIGDECDFDADDCLAQMIFHEICHWLVAGRRGFHREDWGLNNIDDRDVVFEYAAIRLQAALSQPYGLRSFMAVTTDWRAYWNALPEDTLKGGDDPAIEIAQEGFHLAKFEPFAPVLKRALSATTAIANVVREQLPNSDSESSLWIVTRSRHRLGSLMNQDKNLRCGDCAWAIQSETGLNCRQHVDENDVLPEVDANEQACHRWEKRFSIDDCGSCGACCRQGFDVLGVAADDPFLKRHADLVQIRDDGEPSVPRPNGVCVALGGDGSLNGPYRCECYETRPRNCADFEVRGAACLVARRRVGLSR